MARIKRVGLGILGAIKNSFRNEEVLPNEFAELKTPSVRNDYTNYML